MSMLADRASRMGKVYGVEVSCDGRDYKSWFVQRCWSY